MAAVALILLSLACWRWAPLPVAVVSGGLALLAAWIRPRRMRPLLPLLAVVGLILVGLRLGLGDAAFPCSLRCEGGDTYGRILGIDVLWASLAGFALLALASWRRRHRPVGTPTLGLAWILVGASLAYLGLGLGLDVVCRHCLAVHTLVLATAAGALPDRGRWRAPAIAAVFALGLVATLLRLAPVSPQATTISNDPATRALIEGIEAVRTWPGEGLAADLVIDLQCPACARLHQRWEDALRAVPGLGLRTRLLVRDGDATAQDLARWTWAAAAQGEPAYRLVREALLGSPADLTSDDLRPRLADLVDLEGLDRWLAVHGAAIDTLIAEDQARLRAWAADRRTPAVVFHHDGIVLGRVEGNVAAAVVAERARSLRGQ